MCGRVLRKEPPSVSVDKVVPSTRLIAHILDRVLRCNDLEKDSHEVLGFTPHVRDCCSLWQRRHLQYNVL